MEKEKTLIFLQTYNFNYSVENNSIVVKLNFAQCIIIEFNTDNKIIIKDKLVGWNFLSGMIVMNLKNAIILNCLGALAIGVYTIFLENAQNSFNTNALLILFVSWFIVFANYYHSNLENFKNQLLISTIK
jgi:hypothetical protein